MSATVARLIAEPDPGLLAERLSDRVRFLSPVADYEGRDDVAHLLGHIGQVLQGVAIRRELHAVLWLRPLPALRLAVAEMERRLAADPLPGDRR